MTSACVTASAMQGISLSRNDAADLAAYIAKRATPAHPVTPLMAWPYPDGGFARIKAS
jgi:hypothetical protein